MVSLLTKKRIDKMKKKTALVSVSDKADLIILLKAFKKHDIEIISSGGTAEKIRKLGFEVKKVSQVTGVSEYPAGLVKTLHPKIHYAILFDRKKEDHVRRLKSENITPIDFVVCNLYPFEKTTKNTLDREKIISNIDIGGVAMIRAAAKNHKYVTVITTPKDYRKSAEELDQNNGHILPQTKEELALKAFKHTAEYDSMISSYFEKENFPDKLTLSFDKKQELRYGENPHQEASFYKKHDLEKQISFKKLQGKELSYNNLNDLNGVVRILRDFMNHYESEKAVIISKHTNPCGIATSDNLYEAFTKAWDCDKISAFGSVIGANSDIDKNTAELIKSKFIELIIAPGYEEAALETLKEKKNLRLLEIKDIDAFKKIPEVDYQFIDLGMLVQERDTKTYDKLYLKSGNIDINQVKELIRFGILSIKNIKSNSINIVREYRPGYFQMIGAGIGQPNRVIAVELAIKKAITNLKHEFNNKYKEKIKDLILVSDAFFPFDDSIKLSAKYGIKTVVEPGGSIRDKEVIETSEKIGINLIFTGMRHFRH
ncbi:bifunctional phosphoribosylaminoimidazolecarboxamide formyltransferase/IMP cyclohydrolase [Candidatus Woesearchaeota archaeon]|nr:bifunctional phosphoribosylaminoimidazolecarboxamide formyltransferase/IMP cyclohydrolase [Candidatus Woesearchaeota archaeon]